MDYNWLIQEKKLSKRICCVGFPLFLQQNGLFIEYSLIETYCLEV